MSVDPVLTEAQVTRRMIGLRPYLAQVEDISDVIAERLTGTVAAFERELQMSVYPTIIKQALDDDDVLGETYDLREVPLNWEKHRIGQLPEFKMRRRPIISVQRLRMKLSEDYELFEFPSGWYEQHIQFELGIVSVVPVPIVGAMLSSTGNMIFTWLTGRMPWAVIPQFVVVDYTAGYEDPATNPALDEFRMVLADAVALAVIKDIRDMLPSSVSIEGASQTFDSIQQRLEAREADKEAFFTDWQERHNPVPMMVI